MPQHVLLNVGSGAVDGVDRLPPFFRGPDWEEVRLDIDAAVQPDIVASITDMSCIRPESVDAIWSSHNLEHLHDHEVTQALREFLRVLKPDGFLYLKVPDLLAIAELLVSQGLETVAYEAEAGPITPLDMIYGHRASITAGNSYMAHRTGFTPARLKAILATAGFGFGILKRQSYMEVSALVFKGTTTGTERHTRILAELAF